MTHTNVANRIHLSLACAAVPERISLYSFITIKRWTYSHRTPLPLVPQSLLEKRGLKTDLMQDCKISKFENSKFGTQGEVA